MTGCTRALALVREIPARVWFSFIILIAFAAVAGAQTNVTPPTTTVQYLGNPNPQNTQSPITAPLGGIIIKGTGISPVTGQPFRHLWVDDATFGICRIDPDIDTPGPYALNQNTCPFKINGASITGGPMAYDPIRKLLYFADEQRSSQGVIRIGFDPTGDNGHGLLDFSSVFIMGGSTTGARFGGGTTGCPFPFAPATEGPPNALALSPLGDVWVGFKKGTDIVRFNSPGTATSTGFGTCAQFIQIVATDSKLTNGLAFVGHDLWGADGTSPFVIKNADTTCLVPPNGVCSVVNVLAAVGANAVATMSDQYYPATNGNNVYFALQPGVVAGAPPPHNDVAWLGNASSVLANGDVSLTTLDQTFMGVITPPDNPTIQFLSGVAVDSSDPANVVVYSGDDYSGLGTLAKGQWFQSCQGLPPAVVPGPAPTPYTLNCPTPVATAVPGVPLNVVAVAGNAQATVSWSPAQANQPVTSYTVHNSFSSGATVADVVVTPVAGSNFPPTSTVITGLTNGTTYGFEVLATNAKGSSAFSAESNHVTPPGLQVPNPPTACPTAPCAIAGDQQALVKFTVSAPNGFPITSYTVTAYINGVIQPITATVPPPAASSNTGSAVIGGLTNGTTYTFTVHANNANGSSTEGPQTNAVTPSAAIVPSVSIAMSGLTSVATTPAQLTFGLTVTNTSTFPVQNISVTHTLSTVAATIASASRAVNGTTAVVTIKTSTPHFLSIGQTVTIAGVSDASFNGTFTITNVPDPQTFTFSQTILVASSGVGGTATGSPLANIQVAQPGQGTCTTAGPGSVSVTCSVGNMDPGAVVTINVIVQMQSQAIINSATVSGNDVAGTPLVNHTASKTTSPPAPIVQNVSAAVSITGNAQTPTPNVGQAGNIVWTISNVTTTEADNVVVSLFIPNGLIINTNPPTFSVDKGITQSCSAGIAVTVNGIAGTQFACSTPSLGGSRKNGQKPAQTMIITENVTPPAGSTGQVFKPSGTVTFSGTDTVPNSASVTITVR
jgi:hypothetical protein